MTSPLTTSAAKIVEINKSGFQPVGTQVTITDELKQFDYFKIISASWIYICGAAVANRLPRLRWQLEDTFSYSEVSPFVCVATDNKNVQFCSETIGAFSLATALNGYAFTPLTGYIASRPASLVIGALLFDATDQLQNIRLKLMAWKATN